MSYPNSLRVRELWLKMKAYINNRIETLEQGVTMKLLWENPNPTSEFPAQTISLDLSEYDRIWVDYKWGYNAAYVLGTGVDVGETIFFQIIGSSGGIWGHFRTATTNSSGITVSAGTSLASSSSATSNNYNIPLRIYGIKGVQ